MTSVLLPGAGSLGRADAQDLATPLSCEAGAVDVAINRSPTLRFEPVPGPPGELARPREFRFDTGPHRVVRFYLYSTVPEREPAGTYGASTTQLSLFVNTEGAASNFAEPSSRWWQLRPVKRHWDSDARASHSMFVDLARRDSCRAGAASCTFADVELATSDRAVALIVLGFSDDLGGANAANWEHARILLDFREDQPRVAATIDCAYNEGGGVCTGQDSAMAPRTDLFCEWAAARGDFLCRQESEALGHRDAFLLTADAAPPRSGEVATLEAAASALRLGGIGDSSTVAGLGPVRRVHDLVMGNRRFMVLASDDAWYVATLTGATIGSVQLVPAHTVLSESLNHDAVSWSGLGGGWTTPGVRYERVRELYRRRGLVVLQIVSLVPSYNPMAQPEPSVAALTWLGVELAGDGYRADAVTLAGEPNYRGCGEFTEPVRVVSVGRIKSPFLAAVRLQPPTAFDGEGQLKWENAEGPEDATTCVRPGTIAWRDGQFVGEMSDGSACVTLTPPVSVIIGADGRFRPPVRRND